MRPEAFLLATALAASPLFAPGIAAAKEPSRPAACIEVKNVAQLQAIQADPTAAYCLANDIDASGQPNFTPIGSPTGVFTGSLDGKGHTISNLTINSAADQVGLFGLTQDATIKNVRLLNVRVTATATFVAAGGLAGVLAGSTVTDVHVSGSVRCTGTNCGAGGLAGAAGTGASSGASIIRSSSSATVRGGFYAGGLAGEMRESLVSRSFATGAATCTALNCMAAGLIVRPHTNSSIVFSFATGPVNSAGGGGDSRAGGLIAYTESGTTISRTFAAGPVTIGAVGIAAGLIGQHNSGGQVDQSYSVGLVTTGGASVGGLIANSGGNPTILNCYWDTETSGQALSPGGGTGLTTTQLRAALPVGFLDAWAITPGLSYPYLTDTLFKSPLATLVDMNWPFVFTPITQFDDGQYLTPPEHPNGAALATVYTMIARAVGLGNDVNKLKNVAIDKYFWDDEAQKTRWRGAVKDFIDLGPLVPIGADEALDQGNIIGIMDQEKLVILRGTFRRANGSKATHWMLGTMYTKAAGGTVKAVVANDPFTGRQVLIDPETKRVVAPGDFPLDGFKVNGYQEAPFAL